MSSDRNFQIFLAALAVAGGLLVWLASSSYGPGLSTDGARYLSTAENLAAGRGVVDYFGAPLVNWPPFYPLLLAGMHLASGADVFVAAQTLNILSFSAIIYLGGLLFRRSLPGTWVFALAASLVLATALPLLEVAANVAADPLFIVCVLLFLLAAQDFLQERPRGWWQMALLAVAACFLRYAGLALVFSGALVVLWAQRQAWKRALAEAAAFGLMAGAPLAAWALLHNLPANGTLLGSHRPAIALTNFTLIFEKMAGWFAPDSLLSPLLTLLAFAVLAAGLLAASNREQRAAWAARLQSPAIAPSLIFALVYSAMLTFTISTIEHQPAGSQRIHVVLLPVLLVLLGSTLYDLLPRPSGKLLRPPMRSLLLAAFVVWLAFPIFRVQAYVRGSLEKGDVSYYNLYNTRTLRESDIVAHIQTLDLGADELVYSNNEAAAWFFLRRDISRLPRMDTEVGEELEAAMVDFAGWPAAGEQARLIWFERELDYKDLVPTPEQMQEYIRLTITFAGRYGDVYWMGKD
ncbi:MAG: hypothetical protein WD740_03135 [Anaerolineales bacterium]